jgi:hypothetical protein
MFYVNKKRKGLLMKRRTKTHKDTDNFSCHGGSES